MTKTKIALTASAFMLAIGGVFASALVDEPGYYFDNTKPVGQKCVTPKQCQIEDQLQPICTFTVSPGVNKQLFRLDAADDCETTLLREIPQP